MNCFKRFLNVDKIFCISSGKQERIDNINHFNEKFNLELELVKPVSHVDGAISLILTNLQILKQNIDKNIIILEDDFFICDSEENIIKKLQNLITLNFEYDILFFGCLVHKHDILNENFTQLNHFTCTQSIFYKKHIIPLLIQEIESRQLTNQTITWTSTDTDPGFLFWDRLLDKIRRIHNLKFISFYPVVITQNNFYSLLEQDTHEFYNLDFLSLKPFHSQKIKIVDYHFYVHEYLVFEVDSTIEKIKLKLTDCNTGFNYLNTEFNCLKKKYLRIDYKKIDNPFWIQVFHNNDLIFRKQNFYFLSLKEDFKIFHFYYEYNNINFALLVYNIAYVNKNLTLKIKDYCSGATLITESVYFLNLKEYFFKFFIENFTSIFLIEISDGSDIVFSKPLDFYLFR